MPLGVVVCTCNLATLEAKYQNGVGSKPVGGNSPSVRCAECVIACNPAKRRGTWVNTNT